MKEITNKDKIYKQAKVLMLRDNNTSISYIQRKLGIGYNSARDVVELLERDGVISSPNKDGKRKIIS